MLRIIIGFVISIVISNWIYREVVYLFPPFRDFAKSFIQTVAIPTHNYWDDIVQANTSPDLQRDLNKAYGDLSSNVYLAGVFNNKHVRGVLTELASVSGMPELATKKRKGPSIFKRDFSDLESKENRVRFTPSMSRL